MIRGLDRFREYFAEHKKAFVLIGGVACHEWLSTLGLEFRATKDMDVVLVIEALDQVFVRRFWEFVEGGKYQVREKATGERELYRFSKPQDETYPFMIEIFSRKPGDIKLDQGQQVVPVKIDESAASLSAILLDDAYYSLILEQHDEEKNLPFANPTALIPLKAKAWLDLSERAKKGEKIDEKDIVKHRNDVFRIANTLPAESGPILPTTIQEDLKMFLGAFPVESGDWNAILSSLKVTFGGARIRPEDLVAVIQVYFSLA
jgi:hypothetical protein